MRILSLVSVWSKIPNLKDYALMQCVKRSSTSRLSPKKERKVVKPAPKIVFRYGSQDGQIRKFLETRRFVLEFLKKMNRGDH